MNKVLLLGNLGGDPEIAYTPDGMEIAKFSVATNEKIKDEFGNWDNKVEWHKVVAWGNTASFVNKYLKKGSFVFVEGKLSTQKWRDKDGIDRQITRINAFNVQGLGGKNETGENDKPRENNGLYYERAMAGIKQSEETKQPVSKPEPLAEQHILPGLELPKSFDDLPF